MPFVLLLALAQIAATQSANPKHGHDPRPRLRSESAVVRLADTGEIVFSKNPNVLRPIASVTKLLSGVVLEHTQVDEDQVVTVGEDDKDRLKWSRSHLCVGFSAPWRDLVQVALSASENRAMHAVVRSVMPPGDFVALMNETASQLGMVNSHFVDATGIDPSNKSTASDLLRLLEAAAQSDRVRGWALNPVVEVTDEKRTLTFQNPDRLVHLGDWDVVIGKTGYTIEAGRNLVARVILAGRPVDMVFLGSREMASVFGDASRVRAWLLPQLEAAATSVVAASDASTTSIISDDGSAGVSPATATLTDIVGTKSAANAVTPSCTPPTVAADGVEALCR